MKTTPEDIYTAKGQSIRDRAKALTKKQQELYLNGRLGLVIDGTGKDYQKIQKQKEQLEAMGYETAMIFVNTDEDTALERNRKRDRSLSDEEVTKMWKSVQNNLGKFQNSFKSKFFIVDNSEGSNFEAATTSVYKKISAWMKQEPRNKLAQNWISQAKSVRGINEAFVQYMYLEEKSLEGLKKKAEKSGISYSILKKVYDRGMAAWRTGHRPGTTPQQWAYARVNSFITGGKTRTTADADLWKNVRKEELSIDEKFSLQFEEGGAGEYGSDKVTKKYKKDTPGETNEGDAMDATKARHASEKKDIKRKHDREMDAARLRDTRVKNRTTNANEEFEALFNKDLNESFEMAMTSGLGVTYFASDLGIKTHAGFALHPSVVVEEEEEEDGEV